MVTSFGNYYFSGTPSQHERLLRYLFDRMGTGRKISILGWQTEGFWAWNNKIVVPQGEDIVLDKTGLFNYQKTCYYIPSANANYENNAFMYGAQKRFKSTATSLVPPEYFRQMYKVHRSHAITAILFGIGAFYQDIIVAGTGFYPLLFLYGPASTGKDNLCEAVQSLMGIPQTAIQLEGGASTIKAQIREFSQFSNGISQLSEYKRGNPQIDGVLKGLWDRRGYKRGTIESPVATEEVPILSATILTGNDCPDAEALITRLLWEEMKQQEFDDEAKKQYNLLKDMCKKGISGMADFFIHKRDFFADKFLETYREAKRNFTKGEVFKNVPSRITDNLSVLRAVFNILKNDWIFPFTEEEMLAHFEIMVDSQRKKIETDSAANRFWDCILVCMRLTQGEALRMGINLREEGGYLSFNFSTVYSIVQRQWFIQYRENAPSKTELRRQIKEAESFVGEEKAVRINLTINSPTSAIKVNINKLPIRAELIAAIENQRLRGEVKDIQDEENSFY